MFKNMKKKVVLAALVALALGNTMSVSAAARASSASYSGYVTKTADYVTEALFKMTLGKGTNEVSYVEASRSLCSWINNYLGDQVTKTAHYDSAGTYSMEFTTDKISVEVPGNHLSTTMVISTQWFEFNSASTSGTWSPDPF